MSDEIRAFWQTVAIDLGSLAFLFLIVALTHGFGA